MEAKKGYVSDMDDEFAIFDSEAIAMILYGMSQKNVAVSATFNGGQDVLVTAVIGIDQKQDEVYLDINSNEELNKNLVHSKKVHFFAFFAGAKILWNSNRVLETTFEGGKAFKIEMPERIQRVQRRGSFRVSTPKINPVLCHITIKPGIEVAVPLFDICVEGIGVVLPQPLDPAIEATAVFKTCRIEHEDLGRLDVSLMVKSVWEVKRANGSVALHGGLEFANLRPGMQAAIQRFVYKTEREMIAMSRAK
jgi:c-di-GMP-binding flagellar brake protein YcgR